MLNLEKSGELNTHTGFRDDIATMGYCRVLAAAGVAWPDALLDKGLRPIARFLLECTATMNVDVRRVAWRALTAQCKGAYGAVDDGPGRQQYEELILTYCDGVAEAIAGEFSTPSIWHAACAMQMVRHAISGPAGSGGVFNTDNPPSDNLAAALHRILGLCTAEVKSAA